MNKIILSTFFLILFLQAVYNQDFSRNLSLKNPSINGKDVILLQKKLLELGFSSIGEADGWFGPMTENAVRKIQGLLGFNQSGIVDKNLWAAIFVKTGYLDITNYFKSFSYINNINLKSLNKEEINVWGYSLEGGKMTIYKSNDKPQYSEINLFGEMYQIRYFCYFLENEKIIVMQQYVRYKATFQTENAEITNTSYYYSKSGSYEISNGNFSSTSYDKAAVLEIIRMPDKQNK